jgi:hypothetical protein
MGIATSNLQQTFSLHRDRDRTFLPLLAHRQCDSDDKQVVSYLYLNSALIALIEFFRQLH